MVFLRNTADIRVATRTWDDKEGNPIEGPQRGEDLSSYYWRSSDPREPNSWGKGPSMTMFPAFRWHEDEKDWRKQGDGSAFSAFFSMSSDVEAIEKDVNDFLLDAEFDLDRPRMFKTNPDDSSKEYEMGMLPERYEDLFDEYRTSPIKFFPSNCWSIFNLNQELNVDSNTIGVVGSKDDPNEA